MKKFLSVFLIICLISATAYAGVSKTLLSAVAATGASSAVDTSSMETKTINIVASSVTSGATIAVQTSYDGTNYATIASEAITANGTTTISVVGLLHKYTRVNITARTDGTYTVYFYGKS